MTGFDEFMDFFGNITVANIVQIILCIIFLVAIYKKIRNYFVSRYEEDRKRDEAIEEALAAIHKYPEYRQQSINI